jgi:hypothetical protein
MKTLFLAWQAPVHRKWLPIGRLQFDGQRFYFVYLRGVQEAREQYGFQPLASFPSLTEVYESDQLFPLFANRLPQRSRPDYDDYVEWLNLPRDEDDPIVLLSRSGGRRATDSFEVFPCPGPDENGQYHIHFFAHGLRHLPPASIERIGQLRPSESLLLMHDFQNPHDAYALVLRTNDRVEGDRFFVGYCPRYLNSDAFKILTESPRAAGVAVERVNPPPAPLQLRLLCSMTGCWPEGFRPCSSAVFQPIAATEMSSPG